MLTRGRRALPGRRRRLAALGAATAVAVPLVGVGLAQGRSGGQPRTPVVVKTATDKARGKLDGALLARLDAGSAAALPVMVATRGDGAAASALLTGAHVARFAGQSLVVGRASAAAALKIASSSSVVGVSLIQFARTGQPMDDPGGGHAFDAAAL